MCNLPITEDSQWLPVAGNQFRHTQAGCEKARDKEIERLRHVLAGTDETLIEANGDIERYRAALEGIHKLTDDIDSASDLLLSRIQQVCAKALGESDE